MRGLGLHNGDTRRFRAVAAIAVVGYALWAHGSVCAQRMNDRTRILPSTTSTCAADSLYFCLQMQGVDSSSLVDLRQKLTAGYKGVSAEQIVQVAKEFGVPARGAHASLEELDALGPPSILHVNNNHFIVFLGIEGDRIVLFDNRIGIIDCSQEDFARRYDWQGNALLMHETPFLAGLSNSRILDASIAGAGLLIAGLWLSFASHKRGPVPAVTDRTATGQEGSGPTVC